MAISNAENELQKEIIALQDVLNLSDQHMFDSMIAYATVYAQRIGMTPQAVKDVIDHVMTRGERHELPK